MEESRIMLIGRIVRDSRVSARRDPECDRVYDINGLCPTLNAHSGGGLEPKIPVENMKDYKVIGQSHRRRESPDSCYIEKGICKTIDTFSGAETHGGLFVVEREKKR